MRRLQKSAIVFLSILLTVNTVFTGCTTGEEEQKYLIGVSQANLIEPWRIMLSQDIKDEAAKNDGIRLITTDAGQDKEKQRKDIENLLGYGIDLLIVTIDDTQELTPVISDIYRKKGIPVIVVARAIDGDDYSMLITPDNYSLGEKAGKSVSELLGERGGNVLEIRGPVDLQMTKERSNGFKYAIRNTGKADIIASLDGENLSDKAEEALLNHTDKLEKTDVIFAHNDYMALGAYKALEQLKKEGYKGLGNIKIIGVDGFSSVQGGLQLVQEGKIDETFYCPTGGREAIQYAMEHLKQTEGIPKQIVLKTYRVTRENVESIRQMINKEPQDLPENIIIGFSEVGVESNWRAAHTASLKAAAKNAGMTLIVELADQMQKKQIADLEKFIAQKVDVIILSPVVETGWDEILQKAKAADIPVILSDREIEVKEDGLYETYIGGDFVKEGQRAADWVINNVQTVQGTVQIMEIKGSKGASPSAGREKGFHSIIDKTNGFRIVHTSSGDFTKKGGREVVQNYMQTKNIQDIDVIFSHNDDMALGAIEVLKENGVLPGQDIKIVSVDATREAFLSMNKGELNCAVECTPLQGPQIMNAISLLLSGMDLPIKMITHEDVFTQDDVADYLHNRKY